MSIGVFIPARTTSNRLPRKLLLPFGDSNLFSIACKKLSELPDKYGKYALVCEDELIQIAEKYGVTILHREPHTILIDDPIIETMGAVKDAKEDYLMFLNPCLAFLDVHMIQSALEQFEESGAEYATSVKPFRNWLFDAEGKSLSPIDYSSLNTKTIPDMYQAAHCFHIFNRKRFLDNGKMLDKGHAVISVPEEATIDVDTQEDYEYAKWKWENI